MIRQGMSVLFDVQARHPSPSSAARRLLSLLRILVSGALKVCPGILLRLLRIWACRALLLSLGSPQFALFLVRASRQHREPEPYIGCSPCLNSPLSACDLSDTLWAFSTRAVRLYVRRGVFGPFAKICTAPIPKMGQTLAKICTGDLSGKGLRK